MSTTMTAEDFHMQFDAEHRFQFVESEDAMIMAWGHREPEEFLDEVFAYDKLCDPEHAERGTAPDVSHRWAVRDNDTEDGWWIKWSDESGAPITEDVPGAFAITLWGR